MASATGNARRQFCSKGQEFTEENTYRRKDRPHWRVCRICMREGSSWANRSPESKERFYARYPERKRSRSQVGDRVKRGKLKPKPCEVCGALKAEAHHDDYSKPLDVRWLCRIHHAEFHRKIRSEGGK